MDFLDPKKERWDRITLLVGYVLVSLAIAIGAFWLLFLSYGWTKDRQGNVVQNGLLFVSSQPSGAAIFLDGQRYQSDTNSRVITPAGTYTLQITKQGYRIWQRKVTVLGDDVQHFDYPFMWPQKLKTTSLADLTTDPSMATQSPDHRWLLLGKSDDAGTFTMYDFKHPDKPVSTDIKLPAGSFTPGIGAQAWSAVEWAADNKHVLLQHTYATASGTAREYVLLDRSAPVSSVNLTTSLNLGAAETVSLYDNRVAQLYVYNANTLTLRRMSATDGTVASTLEHVLAYKTYADNKILYVTDKSPTGKAVDGQVSAVLQEGQETITLRTLPAAGTGTYLLNLAEYAGDWYVGVGATNGTAVYVYKNPQSDTGTGADTYPDPWRRLPISNPSYLSFSDNTQFLMAESGQQFVTYDLENLAEYRYTIPQPLDQPQLHATWMDGDRLLYVSGGKLVVFDYDSKNRQTLVPANASYLPFFAPDYTYLYTARPDSSDGSVKPGLDSTPLTLKQ